MPPLWDPKEAKSGLYKDVEKHSEGMYSFTYKPPTRKDLEALKGTRTYERFVSAYGEEALAELCGEPAEPETPSSAD